MITIEDLEEIHEAVYYQGWCDENYRSTNGEGEMSDLFDPEQLSFQRGGQRYQLDYLPHVLHELQESMEIGEEPCKG